MKVLPTDKRTSAYSQPLCYTLKFQAYKKDKNIQKEIPSKDIFFTFFSMQLKCSHYSALIFFPTKS